MKLKGTVVIVDDVYDLQKKMTTKEGYFVIIKTLITMVSSDSEP